MKTRSICIIISFTAFFLLTCFSSLNAQEPIVQSESTHGTLVVQSNPPFADVRLDGKIVGKTPLTIRPISAGAHELIISLAGHSSYRTLVHIEAGRSHSIAAPLSAAIFMRWQEQYSKAVVSSILLPGKGQVDNGHQRGWVYFMSFLGTGYFAFYCTDQYKTADRNYQDQWIAYRAETDPVQAASRYRDLQGSLDKMENYRERFGYAVATMGVIWAVNMVDVLFFSVPRPVLVGDGNIRVTMDARLGQLQAGLSFRF